MNKWIIMSIVALLAGLAFLSLDRQDSPQESADEFTAEASRLSELLGSAADSGYTRAIDPREFSFPGDHGPHPDFRNEWWYLTGNLDSNDGRRFGYELTIFRFSLAPGMKEDKMPNDSRWRTDQVYIAHFALTDAESGQFHVEQRFSRGALGLAGAQASPFRVWIEDWEIGQDSAAVSSGDAEEWRLFAPGDDLSLELKLTALKRPVLNGISGLSQKSAEVGNASYYYSITRMQSTGVLRIGADKYAVDGLSWLDREWSSSALSADQQGWDWFALQLSDGSDLMFYNLRKRDGSQDRHSAGTWTGADGGSRHLSPEEVSLTVVDQWRNPAGDAYPSRWNIEIESLDLRLTVTPVIADQELQTTVRYWEGAVDVEGTHEGRSIEGRGYVELTGYSH